MEEGFDKPVNPYEVIISWLHKKFAATSVTLLAVEVVDAFVVVEVFVVVFEAARFRFDLRYVEQDVCW